MNVVVRYNEVERRKKFAKRYGIRLLIWLFAIIVSFILVQVFVSPVDCQESQAKEWGRICHNCSMENCVDCSKAGKDGCDEFKVGYFFDEVTGSVMSTQCLMEHCNECAESGIRGCDLCDEGFRFNELLGFCQSTVCKDIFCSICEENGSSSCDVCHEGFKFNKETGECQDTVCRVDLCTDCSESGVDSCDTCREGHYFEEEYRSCFDLTCKVEQCEKCNADPFICEKCVKNYWLDIDRNECLDGKCLVPNCEDCTISGPEKCDKQVEGYFMAMNGDIIDCDDKPESVICKKCSDKETCSSCAQGYRLEDGKCLQCELDTCAVCDAVSGRCN